MDKQIQQYLEDYKNGRIKMGLDIGCIELDEIIRYKQGQFNIINGIDNVGKTAWMLWYFLCLSNKHNLRWQIWSGENKGICFMCICSRGSVRCNMVTSTRV